MKTVHRYVMRVDGYAHAFDLTGPVVHVGMHHDAVNFWALAGVEARRERTFQVYGTGFDVPDGATYVGTAIDEAAAADVTIIGELVWHLFEHGPAVTE